jgi:hypothetical protein
MTVSLLAINLLLSIDTSANLSGVCSHPRLLTNESGVARARERASKYAWARAIVNRLSESAGRLESMELPTFDKDWWEQARTKRWQDIYPEVNYHTMFAVAEPVRLAHDAALAYVATGEPRYAELVRKVLLHYTGYEFFAVHPDCGLNWSVWCNQALQAYDLIWDVLSGADRAKIDDFFARALRAIKQNDEWWQRDLMGGLFNNHFAWHKLFIGSYGLFYGKDDLVDYAINSDQGVKDLIENGIRDNGLWFESSLNYHFTALRPLVELAVEMKNAGCRLDLWHHRWANGRSLSDLVLGPICVLYPDRSIPTIGDTYGHRIRLMDLDWYYEAYCAYRTSELEWLMRQRMNVPVGALFCERLPEWLEEEDSAKTSPTVAPEAKTRVFPEHGYVALRSQEGRDYWNGHGFCCFLSYDSDGVHSHRDKFNLTAFARGVHIAVDAEAITTAGHAFSSKIQGELNRSTLCHNTLMVDGLDHRPIAKKLELVQFVDGSDIKLATIADTQGLIYPGIRIMRTVAVTRDFLLDVFQVASDSEHVYDYLFHTYSDNGSFVGDEKFVPTELGSQGSWKWLRDARSARLSEDWSVLAKQGDVTIQFTMIGHPQTEAILCAFPREDRFSAPSIPMLIARRKARSTVFVALVQAERGAIQHPRISLEAAKHALLRIIVRFGDDKWEFATPKLE